MKRRWALALVLLGIGCTGMPQIPIRLFDVQTNGKTAEPSLPPSVLTACDILGFDCHADTSKGSRGKVTLYLFPDPNSKSAGHSTNTGNPCFKTAWSIDEDRVIAHEIAHTFRLQHTDDPDNLMYPIREDWTEFSDFDEEQLEDLHFRGESFSTWCRPIKRGKS